VPEANSILSLKGACSHKGCFILYFEHSGLLAPFRPAGHRSPFLPHFHPPFPPQSLSWALPIRTSPFFGPNQLVTFSSFAGLVRHLFQLTPFAFSRFFSPAFFPFALPFRAQQVFLLVQPHSACLFPPFAPPVVLYDNARFLALKSVWFSILFFFPREAVAGNRHSTRPMAITVRNRTSSLPSEVCPPDPSPWSSFLLL